MTQGVAYVGERRRLLEVREDGQKYKFIATKWGKLMAFVSFMKLEDRRKDDLK